MTEGETESESALFSSLLSVLCVSEQSGTQQHNRGRSHIAPKNAWKTLGALLSPFFPKRSGGCAPEAFVVAKQPSAALSGALAAFWKVEMFLSRCGADAPGKNLPLWARIPRFSIWNNELESAKDAICERPLNLYVCRSGALWLAYHRTQTQSATQWEFLFNPSTDIDSYYSYDTRTWQKCFIRTGYFSRVSGSTLVSCFHWRRKKMQPCRAVPCRAVPCRAVPCPCLCVLRFGIHF